MYVTKLPKLFSKKGYEVCIWQYECILESSTVTHIENEAVTRLQFSKDDCVETRLTLCLPKWFRTSTLVCGFHQIIHTYWVDNVMGAEALLICK